MGGQDEDGRCQRGIARCSAAGSGGEGKGQGPRALLEAGASRNPNPCSLRKPPCLPRNRYVQGLSVWSVGRVVHHCAGRREHLACLRGSSASGGSRTRGCSSQGVPQVRGHLHMGSDLSHLGLKQLLVPPSVLLLCFVSASPAGLSVLWSHCFIPSTSGQTVF